MKNSKHTKRALFASVFSMMLCIAMLVGSTFAWFTDSVTSGQNKIVAGNLDISATYQNVDMQNGTVTYTIDGFTRVADGIVKFAADTTDINKDNAIITEDIWEPGAVGAKLITVKSDGNLSAKIKLNFTVNDGGLQDALWFDFVQVKDGKVTGQFTEREMSTLATFSNAIELPLSPNGNISFILLYGMKEEAGNEYMGKTFSANVTILAGQDTVESDSFDNQYDKDALVDFVPVSSADDLATVVAEGGTASLDQNIALNSALNVLDAAINGNGNKITGGQTGNNARIINLTNKNGDTYGDVSLTLNGVHMTGEMNQYNSKGLSIYDAQNATLNMRDSSIAVKAYAIRIGTGIQETATVNMENSTLEAWGGFVAHGKTNATFKNVIFNGTNGELSGKDNSYDVVELHAGSEGSNLMFENCTFNLTRNGNAIYGFFGAQYAGEESKSTVTYNNCKFIANGQEISVEDLKKEENSDFVGATVTIDGAVINP